MIIAHKVFTTVFELDGFPNQAEFGIVRGITIRFRSNSGTLDTQSSLEYYCLQKLLRKGLRRRVRLDVPARRAKCSRWDAL
jgi:hypothetical protein